MADARRVGALEHARLFPDGRIGFALVGILTLAPLIATRAEFIARFGIENLPEEEKP